MRTFRSLAVVCLLLVSYAPALAQDPVKVDPTHYKVVFENASVRVLKIDYALGAKSTTHQHPDAMVIPLVASKVRFTMPDGKSMDQELAAESGMYTPAGTHSVANTGTTRIDGILVEFKTPTPGKAALPTARAGMAMKVLAEGPRAMAYRTTADPTFQEPAGSKHDYDQIVIALGSGTMSLAIDGKPVTAPQARGDVQFIGRGTPHEAKNISGKPVDFVIVAIK
jgi:beta-alanine degradation protein BauB